jgi:hypothetical protein
LLNYRGGKVSNDVEDHFTEGAVGIGLVAFDVRKTPYVEDLCSRLSEACKQVRDDEQASKEESSPETSPQKGELAEEETPNTVATNHKSTHDHKSNKDEH